MATYPIRRITALMRAMQVYGSWPWADRGRERAARDHEDKTSPMIYGPYPFGKVLVGHRLDEYVSRWLLEGRSEDGIRVFFRSNSKTPIDRTLVVMSLQGFEALSTIAMQHHAARIERERRSRESVEDQR